MAKILKLLDERFQTPFDRLVWALEECGIVLPKVLRETNSAMIVCGLGLVASAVLDDPMQGALVAMALTPALFFTLMSWQAQNADAKREWNQVLARKYIARALLLRDRVRTIRMMGVACIAVITAYAAVPISNGSLFWTMLLVQSVLYPISMYLDSAIPTPPEQKQHDPVEAKLDAV